MSFYQERFLQAFPGAVQEIPADHGLYDTPGEEVARTWALRTVERFACLFGLVAWAPDPAQEWPMAHVGPTYRMRKTPLFDRAVQWQLG